MIQNIFPCNAVTVTWQNKLMSSNLDERLYIHVLISMSRNLQKERSFTTEVKNLLEKHPSRPWTSENLVNVLHELLASNVVGEDSDSSIESTTHDYSDLDVIQKYGLAQGRESRLSRMFVDARELRRKGSRQGKKISINSSSAESLKLKKGSNKPKISISQLPEWRKRPSDVVDLGKMNANLIRKRTSNSQKEELPIKLAPRVIEMVEAIKTTAKYNMQPENFKTEDEIEEKIELNRLLKSYKKEMAYFGIKEKAYKGPSIKGISTFRYIPLRPKKQENDKAENCHCKECRMNRLWVETKRRRSDALIQFLGEPQKRENFGNTWNCQCEGQRSSFNKNQMLMKIKIPQSMRPDELKKLNTVPRFEVYKHIRPADNGKANIKNAVTCNLEPSRPVIQQEMTCHTNEMRCVLLPPPFTGKVTKFETPDWLLEYNKRYIYDHFYYQSKNIPNVCFMHFSYKKNLAVLIEEIIQGCMNRTDIFDDDTCQCTFLCKCAHKTVQKPNATLFDTVRQAKKYCAVDLRDDNVYEASDYVKSGDKTYFVCSKLCNTKMKLHKQLHA